MRSICRQIERARPIALRGRAAHCAAVICVLALLPGHHGVSRAGAQQLQVGALKLNGDVYGYEYLPAALPGAHNTFELYALSLLVNADHGPWGFALDYRIRTSKLRPYYHGATWVQQAYVSYHTPVGEVRAGSFYRRVGLAWDGSFYGNIEYFDGLMLDPEVGLGLSGTHALARRLGLEYSAQYFATDSGTNGSLSGRDYVSQPGARMRNEWTARLAPVWHVRRQLSLTAGASLAYGTINRTIGPNDVRRQWAADATLQDHDWLVYGELLQQAVLGPVVEAPRNATYTLFGTRRARGRFQPRLNFSSADYLHSGPGFLAHRESILQPGITIEVWRGLSVIAEYNYWRATVASPRLLDRSANLVLWYHF